MQPFNIPPPTRVHPNSLTTLESIKNSAVTVLCGRNNSGKSFLLRILLQSLGSETSYLGPARYSNFNVLAPYGFQPNRKSEKYLSLLRHFQNNNQNLDNSPLNLQQAISELNDEDRTLLFQLISQLLGADTQIKYTIPNNSMSQKFVDVDGFNLSFTSSGFRLVITLLTCLLDKDYNRYLIDEPELGLSPEIQGVFADWLLDDQNRARYLPHMTNVVLATHSPVFLDRRTIGNNVIVDRIGSDITLKRIETVQELNSLQFRLLGNRFETMFLPSAILLVEGKTDHAYLSRLINLKAPNSTVSVINANSDSRIRDIVAVARQMFGDIRRSPYAQRIFVILDARHGQGLRDQLGRMGVDNIVVWDNNGIEFLYPQRLLENLFGKFTTLNITDDIISANGHGFTKQELNDYVLNGLRADEELPDELIQKLMGPLEKVLY
jgi:predicted ATP-dependent endonuclease of OLD family